MNFNKLAGSLVLFGVALIALERFGLPQIAGPNHPNVHLDGTLLSILFLAPVALIAAGGLVFLVGRVLRR
jgi:hypothetical protein